MSNEAAVAYATADAYRLVGVFLQLPTEEVARGVSEGAVASDLKAILDEMGCSRDEAEAVLRELPEPVGLSAADGGLTALRRDFTRLFTNPEKPLVPIYESVFKGSKDFDTSALVFVSPTALDAERAYKEFGMAVDPAKHDSPDHMCAEVDYLCALYWRMGELLELGDDEAVVAIRGKIDEFSQSHLLKWGDCFFSLVKEHALTAAYRMVGALGALLILRGRDGKGDAA